MPFSTADARSYIANVRWQFAKTMPQWPQLDGWEYWTMGEPVPETILVNRARVEQPDVGAPEHRPAQ